MAAGAVAVLFSPLGALYNWGSHKKQKQARAPQMAVPVICIGNLTAGGTGKTPITIAIAKELVRRAKHPHILTRGFGGRIKTATRVDIAKHSAADVGDEALLLAVAAPTWISPNRAETAQLAIAAGADVLLMDDGHQNTSIKKDLSLIVVDGAVGFGNGRVIPAGPLRESVAQGLERADAVVVVGTTTAHTTMQLAGWRGHRFEATLTPDTTRIQKGAYVAFAGIGRPEKFFETLRSTGAKLIEGVAFPDHHPYSTAELTSLQQKANDANARLITTQKDFVRINPALSAGIEVLTVSADITPEEKFFSFIESGIAAAIVARQSQT